MKKLTAWVEKSFVNKTIFVFLVVSALVVVFVLIPKGIKLIQKTQLINKQIVFFVSGGKKYHLYDNCSNMDDPKESTESKQIQASRTRCSIGVYYGAVLQKDVDTLYSLEVGYKVEAEINGKECYIELLPLKVPD